MPRWIIALAFALAVLGAPARDAAAIIVVYEYVGEEFTNHVGGFFPANDRLTGQIEVDVDLLPGAMLANQAINVTHIPNFAYTDGDREFNQSNVGTGVFFLGTDANGDIVDWSVRMGEGSFTFESDSDGNPYFFGDISYIFTPNSLAASTSTPGSWRRVPAPGAAVLMLLGLAALGAPARRQAAA